MKWEHIFAFAQGAMVLRHEAAHGSTPTNLPILPLSVEQYIFELGANDGYEFAGSYPKDGGVVLVMKRQQAKL